MTSKQISDGLGRLVQKQTVGAVLATGTKDVLVDSWYDGYGQRLAQTVPYEVNSGGYFHTRDGSKASTQTAYDVLGRPYREIATDGSFTEYNYGDLKVTRTDALGHATQTLLDDWGRTVQVIPPAGPGVTYTYDEADNLTQAVRGGATTSLYYDKAGRKIEMDDPDMGNNWFYVYNAVNNLTQQTDARSWVISLTYDKLDRLTGKTYSGGGSCTIPAVTYTYDEGTNGFGQRTGMADGSGSTAWLYDSRGRMTQETKVITGSGTFKTQWSYFSNDQIEWMKYPNGNGGAVYEMLSYTYHPQGTVNTAASGAVNYVSGMDYDAAGRVDRHRLGGGTITVDYVYYGWTAWAGQGRLQQIKSGIASDLDSLQNLQYTYDLVGNVLTIADSLAGGTQTQTFTYDAADRLSSALAAGGSGGTYNQTYAYNATTGNLSSKGGTTYSYTYSNHKHAVSSTSAGSTFSYNANGSMTQRVVGGQTYNLTYDAENRLVGVSGTVTATFVYDGDGNRVQGTIGGVTTAYVGNYYEWSSSSNTKYIYAGGQRVALRKDDLVSYLLTDHLGSTAVTANTSGVETGELRYKAWGEERYASGTTPTTYRFTGQRTESLLGLYFYGARWYDSSLSRWVQPDSLIPDLYHPADWDRFSYTRNNPVRYTDPTGHLVCSDKHVAEGDCSDEGVGLWRFGITLTGNWTNEHKNESKEAALAVGAKIAEELGGTAWDAFRKVFGKLEIFWGNGEGHGLSDECTAITSGGCTSSAHLINFMTTWSNPTSAVNNMIHEFGHAFNNLLWFDNRKTGQRDRLPEAFMRATGGLERSTGGYAGPYGTWQQSQQDSTSENFADMFLGWTYAEWEKSSAGIYRGGFMTLWMPHFIGVSLYGIP